MERRPADTLAEIEKALGTLDGREILDVGCGQGRLAAALLRRGAKVSGVDPEAATVEAARKAVPEARIERAGAEALPFPDASFDGVVMLNSLHHVPGDKLAAALREMARVARPKAPIVVVEPLAAGSFFDAMRPLEDETAVRAAAQNAIAAACAFGGPLDLVDVSEFERVEAFRDVEQFLERLVAVDPARLGAVEKARPEVETRFSALVEHGPKGLILRQPLRMHRLEKA